MQVSDILRLKGNTLFKVSPTSLVMEAVDIMASYAVLYLKFAEVYSYFASLGQSRM